MNATRTAKTRMLELGMNEDQVRSLLEVDSNHRLGTADIERAHDLNTQAVVGVSSETWKRIAFPVGTRALEYSFKDDMVRAPNRLAIIREDTGELLNVTSERYQLVPHENAFRPIAEAIQQMGLRTLREDAVVSQGGAYARYEWTLDVPGRIASANGDDLRWRVSARNSYNYESKFELSFGAFRLICSNGLMAPASVIERLGGKHIIGLDVPGAIAQVSTFLENTAAVQEVWESWAQKDVTREIFEKYLEKLGPDFSKAAREAILENFDTEVARIGSTAWAAYNAMTWYATHKIESRADRTGLVQDIVQRRAIEVAQRLAA